MSRKFISFFLCLVIFCGFSTAYGKDKDIIPQYEIIGLETGTQGSYLVNVTIISKKNNPSDDIVKRVAVHGVLFKGFSNKELRQMQKPLVGSAANEAQHVDFYNVK